MPKLPTLDDLGSRPVPVSRRQIATNPRAGAVGQALEGLGQTVGSIGQQMLEQQDKLNYASAKAAVLKADVTARQELENDPDYETWGTRYSEKMAAARDAAAKSIGSKSQRAMFAEDADVDIARGGSELGKLANGRRRSARVATLNQSLADLQDVGQNALDDATRETAIKNASDLIQAGIDGGDIDAVQGGELRRRWTESYVVQQIEARRARGDLTGAQAFFEANRGRLDVGTEVRLNQQILDATENRENLTIAEEVVYGAGPTAGTADASGRPTNQWTSVATNVAREFGLKPAEVAAVMSYETGGSFSPTVMGGKNGQYMGLIQFGPAERAKYGITKSSSPEQWTKAITSFLHDRGFKRGMGVLDLYSTINAGQPGRYNASDGNGTVRGHVDKILRDHTAKATAWLGSQSPTEHDLNTIYGTIDERAVKEGWTPERREAVKAQAARLVDRDEGLLRREQAATFDRALAKADSMGANFTNVSQLGDDFYRASAADQHRLRAMAEANARPKEPPANGDVIRSLHIMAIQDPGKFAGVDLRAYKPFMTAGEFDEVAQSQARAKATPRDAWNPRTGIQSAMSWGEKFGGVDLSKPSQSEDRYRVYRYMEVRAREWSAQNKGKVPGENEYQAFFREATREVTFTRSFLGFDALAPDAKQRAFEGVSNNYKALITRQFKAQFGRNPTDDEVQQWFERMGAELK